jgi:hypothetical protein
MGNAIILSIIKYIRRSIELVAIAYIINRIFKELEILAQISNTNRIIWFKDNSINIRILLAYKYII